MKRALFSVACAGLLVVGPVSGRVLASQAATTAKAGSDTVEDRIERRIHNDSTLKRYDVKVSVSGDIVTLTGTVASAAERDRATRLAKVQGITRVDNQVVVDRSARGTTGAIDKAAEKTKEGTSKAIDKSKEGAEKAVEKSKEGTATGLSKTGEGVKKAGSAITDAFILASVKTRLFGEDVLKGSDINVDCDHHVVTLRGTVPSDAARARAIELTRKADGVDRVVDRLTIGPKK